VPRLQAPSALQVFAFGSNLAVMDYKGIRYTLRLGIARQQWSVAVHPAGGEVIEKSFTGARPQAELRAHSMIDAWLKRQRERAD
jgi:hypothetical protein